jgi:hypothetical protein
MAFSQTFTRPNASVQQQKRLERQHTSESRTAGPVCCNGWFGGITGAVTFSPPAAC